MEFRSGKVQNEASEMSLYLMVIGHVALHRVMLLMSLTEWMVVRIGDGWLGRLGRGVEAHTQNGGIRVGGRRVVGRGCRGNRHCRRGR